MVRFFHRFASRRPPRGPLPAGAFGAFALLASTALPAFATHGDLATFGAKMSAIQPYSVFALDGTAIEIKNTTVNGNVGVANLGSLSLKSSGFVDGDIFMDSGATLAEYDPSDHNGTLSTGLDLSGDVFGAVDFASYTASLDPDTIVGSINTDLTLNGNPGLNVFSVSEIRLEGTETLTLDGPADAVFVLNVSGIFELKAASASVVSAGGAGPGNIFINLIGPGSTVTTEPGTLIEGIFLAPERSVNFANVTGKVIADTSIAFQGGTVIDGVTAIPEPSSALLLLAGACLFLRRRAGPFRAVSLSES